MFGMLANVFDDSGDGSRIIVLLLSAIAAILLITGMRRKQRERARVEAGLPRGPRVAPVSQDQKERLRRDLEMLIGELQDLSRKITAEIDTRFSKLEAAIRDADRRIATLNSLARAADSKPADKTSQPPEQDVRHTVVYELSDAGFTPVEIAKDLGRTPGEIELILNLRRTAQQ